MPGDNFSIRWSCTLAPRRSETYTLTTVSDDKARVCIDGKLVIDSWSPHGPKIDKAEVRLDNGKRHSIKIEYAEQTGEAHMKLPWSSLGQDQQIIPASQLYAD
ncbi:PA14 domain-containing protein [Streptomyces lasiicapitis]|uniref:PA14 domain-containing protein n=1 Tax=Streptomyces lasiicapitis TaxID=1923961 RepID=UPI00364FA343